MEKFIEEITNIAFARTLESELGLPENWITFIVAEDEWSFIIKSHALLESAANRALTEALGNPNLSDFVARLELSGVKTGKVALLVTLGHLDSDCKRFISKLSEIRNTFVHEVSNTNLNINEFLSNLNENDRKGYVKAFKWRIKDWTKFNVKEFQGDEAKTTFYIGAASSWDKSKVMAIWFGVLYVIRKLHRAFLKEKTNQHEITELRELALSVRKGSEI